MKVKCGQCGKENEAFEGGGVGIKCAKKNIAGVTVPRVLKWVRKPRRVNRIAEVMRERRAAAGLTQRQVAAASGVGVRSISTFESGFRTNGMKVKQLADICGAIGISLSEFFGFVEGK